MMKITRAFALDTIKPASISMRPLRPCTRSIDSRRQRGVTLIEILVTLLVLAVGLLGLAALQGFSLQSGQVSYYRTQATNVGYEVADFARTNRSVINQTVLQTMAKQLAEQRLPQGDAAVTLNGSNDTLVVSVSWLDDREAESASAGAGNQSFQFSTRI